MENVWNTSLDQIGYTVDGVCFSNETLSLNDIIFGVFYVSGVFLICIICFIGNGLIIHAILYYKHLQTVHNWFILSLAISDVIQGITIPFYTMGHTSKLVILEGLGEWKWCQLMVVMITAPQTVSAYNVVGVTFVRFLAIVRPLHFKHLLERKQVYVGLATAGIWILGYLSAILLYVKPEQPDKFCGICRTELIYDVWQVIVFMLLNIVIPVLIMSILYFISIRIISKKKKLLRASSVRGSRTMLQRETRMTKIVATLLGFYSISWTPFIAYEIFIMTCSSMTESCNDFRYIRAASRLFYFSNVAVNVFIYAGRSNEFRHALDQDQFAIKKCLGMKAKRRYRNTSSVISTTSPSQTRSNTVNRSRMNSRTSQVLEHQNGRESNGGAFNSALRAYATDLSDIHSVNGSVKMSSKDSMSQIALHNAVSDATISGTISTSLPSMGNVNNLMNNEKYGHDEKNETTSGRENVIVMAVIGSSVTENCSENNGDLGRTNSDGNTGLGFANASDISLDFKDDDVIITHM